MGNPNFSITYKKFARDRPVSAIRVQRAAGDPRRGWLTADGWTLPVALGRGGILANKREGDGGTPKGTFRPIRLWWGPDRHARPRTFLPGRPITPTDAWCVQPADPADAQRDRRPTDARRSSLRFHHRARPQHQTPHCGARQRGVSASGA